MLLRPTRNRRLLAPIVALSVALPIPSGCTGPTTPDPNNLPPDIPPMGTFVIDFDDFQGDGGGGGESARIAQSIPGGDWLFAAANVGIWNTILTVTLAVPVAAFVESFNHEPTLQSDGSWAWSYDVLVGVMLYSARLEARITGANVNWEMYLSKSGEFTDVLWFTGESNLITTSGNWILNRDPDNLEPFIRIDWSIDPNDETGDVRYTNIVPDGADNGGFIFAGTTTDPEFDTFYELFNVTADNTTFIEWNRESKAGRVMDEAQYSDTDWHCWDEMLQNTECAEQ